MEHHYTESLDHDDIKFYPQVTKSGMRSGHDDIGLALGHDDIKLIDPTCTEPYYTRTVLIIAECRHTELPRADRPPNVLRSDVYPPQLNLVLQSSTTPGQFDMWQNADIPRSGVPPPPTPWLSNLMVQSTITPGEFDMWKCSDVLRSDVHPPELNLVLQSSTTSGQFDMWQNADVPRSGVPPPQLSNLVVQNTITPGEFDMWKNSDALRSDVHPLTNPP